MLGAQELAHCCRPTTRQTTKPQPNSESFLIIAVRLPAKLSSEQSSLFTLQGRGYSISIPGGSWVTSRGRGEYLGPQWAWMAGGEWIGSFTQRVTAARLHVPSAPDSSASWSFCFSAARMTALCHSSPEYAFLPGMDAVHMARSIVSAWQTRPSRKNKKVAFFKQTFPFLSNIAFNENNYLTGPLQIVRKYALCWRWLGKKSCLLNANENWEQRSVICSELSRFCFLIPHSATLACISHPSCAMTLRWCCHHTVLWPIWTHHCKSLTHHCVSERGRGLCLAQTCHSAVETASEPDTPLQHWVVALQAGFSSEPCSGMAE